MTTSTTRSTTHPMVCSTARSTTGSTVTTRRQFFARTGAGVGLALLGAGLGCAAAPAMRPARARGPAHDPTRAPVAVFFDAVLRGDVRAVARLLDDAPGLLDARDPDDRSGFTVALLAGRAAVADLLRARGYRTDASESAWVGDWERFEELVAGDVRAVNAAQVSRVGERVLAELTRALGERADVIGPRTTGPLRDRALSLGQIARETDTAYIVNARFVGAYEAPEILVELIRTGDGRHVWVHYYRGFDDWQAIVAEIVAGVTAALAAAPASG